MVPGHKVVDANANKPGIIDLFKSHSLGLIGLEDAKDDQCDHHSGDEDVSENI